jgi:hypothetical protein
MRYEQHFSHRQDLHRWNRRAMKTLVYFCSKVDTSEIWGSHGEEYKDGDSKHL